ncbi:hypothetical protein T484DRAFT_1923635 [Baffinella frigidus]|nr:hypothetical protein T484DRAFT_1923635 [Cryptophyta sp. CCMP2293]
MATLDQPGATEHVRIDALHCSVLVDTESGPFTKLGYVTWKCLGCGTWRVPGAPFCKAGEKAVFLTSCAFGDTSPMCCNCERNKETIVWQGRTLRLHRAGIKLLAPTAKLVDVANQEVVWDKENHPMDALKNIMKNSKAGDRPNANTSWYAEMACDQCRTRAGLRTHLEIRQQRILDLTQIEIERLQKGAKKVLAPYTMHHTGKPRKPETENRKQETRNRRPETGIKKPETGNRKPGPGTWNPTPKTPHPKPWTLDPTL